VGWVFMRYGARLDTLNEGLIPAIVPVAENMGLGLKISGF
jgi:hypothetical protein